MADNSGIGVKFGRNYLLNVELTNGTTLTIEPPFTLEFDIQRNTLSSCNVASIRIYNLSRFNREQIEFNIYNQQSFRLFKLQAGYGTNLPTVFLGNISQAWSVREGVNFITQIECFDGGYAFNTAQTTLTAPAGTSNKVVIQNLVSSLGNYNLTPGVIGSYLGVSSRGKTYTGPTTRLLSELTGGGFFVDNGVANCLGNSECIKNNFPLINSQTGLLGTPVREQQILTFDMIFEPRVQAGQIINLQSSTISNTQQSQAVNGNYKVTSVRHKGMISGSVCGEAITTLGMFLGQNGPDGLTTVPA
jgi:hypothetical protein